MKTQSAAHGALESERLVAQCRNHSGDDTRCEKEESEECQDGGMTAIAATPCQEGEIKAEK